MYMLLFYCSLTTNKIPLTSPQLSLTSSILCLSSLSPTFHFRFSTAVTIPAYQCSYSTLGPVSQSLPRLKWVPGISWGKYTGILRDTSTSVRGLAVFTECLAVGLACGDQCRLTGSGSALEALHDDALYKSTCFTLFYFTLVGTCSCLPLGPCFVVRPL